MNFDVSEEQRAALKSLRGFLQDEICPIVAEHGDSMLPHDVVRDILAKLSPFGLGGGTIPEEAGGFGIDYITSGMLYEELARSCPGVSAITMLNEVVGSTIALFAPQELKERYLPGIVSGQLISSVAITEPSVGSNPRDMNTRAILNGDNYHVNGEKTWISNAHISDFCVVICKTGDGDSGGLSMILVDRKEHGYTSQDIPKLGLNSWSTGQLFFDDTVVPASNMIGAPGAGLQQTMKVFERARCYVACVSLGIGQMALELAIEYAKDRIQWGKPIAGHQLIQAKIAEMATELEGARLLNLRGLHSLQKGERCDTYTSMAKYYATEAAVRITSQALQIYGAYGLSKEYPMEQLFRDARVMTIPDGTTDIQKLIIGRNLLGVSAFGDSRPDPSRTAKGVV